MLESLFGIQFGSVFDIAVNALVIILVLIVAVQTFKKIYVVVPPHQVHVVVRGRTKTVYMSRDGYSASYFYIPMIMARIILPLEQIPISVNQMSLHDKDFAPFRCNIVAWLIVDEPTVAAERIGEIMTVEDLRELDKEKLIQAVSTRLSRDISPLIQSVSRTSAMKLTIVQIFQDRKLIAKQIEEDIDVSLKKWGLTLTDLEVLHIEDDPPEAGQDRALVISNLERQRAKSIEAEARTAVAIRDREARIAESDNKKTAELTEAQNEETYRKRHIEKEKAINITTQQKELETQQAIQKANEQKIHAERTYSVGKAEYEAEAIVKTANGTKEASIKESEGKKQSKILEADGESEYKLKTGKANADITEITGKAEGEAKKAVLLAEAEGVRQKLLAEADGKAELALAEKALQEGAAVISMVYAARDVEIAKYVNLAKAVSSAKTQIIAGGMTELFGQTVGPMQGASFGASLTTFMNSLPDEAKKQIKDLLPENMKEMIK